MAISIQDRSYISGIVSSSYPGLSEERRNRIVEIFIRQIEQKSSQCRLGVGEKMGIQTTFEIEDQRLSLKKKVFTVALILKGDTLSQGSLQIEEAPIEEEKIRPPKKVEAPSKLQEEKQDHSEYCLVQGIRFRLSSEYLYHHGRNRDHRISRATLKKVLENNIEGLLKYVTTMINKSGIDISRVFNPALLKQTEFDIHKIRKGVLIPSVLLAFLKKAPDGVSLHDIFSEEVRNIFVHAPQTKKAKIPYYYRDSSYGGRVLNVVATFDPHATPLFGVLTAYYMLDSGIKERFSDLRSQAQRDEWVAKQAEI